MYTREQLLKLNPERLELLAGLLESGIIAKAEGYLCRREAEDQPWRMCCMGAGTRLAMEEGIELEEVIQTLTEGRKFVAREFQIRAYHKNGMYERSVFPDKVQDWFGFPQGNPYLPLPEGVRDKTGSPFQDMGSWNDKGPGRIGAEPDFTTIAAGIRELARMAREARNGDAEAGS